MKIYLDVSCLNRPFDDQQQLRIRMEAEAVQVVLRFFDSGVWSHMSSSMAVAEIQRTRNRQRRDRMMAMLPAPSAIIDVGERELLRAEELQVIGIRAADAVHVAAAEAAEADVLLTCDDKLIGAARRHPRRVGIRVCNPVTWVQEHETDTNT